jgi:putative ABC transport system permease protein
MLFENGILGLVGIGLAFILSHPVLYELYHQSDMRAFGYSFQFSLGAFGLISFVVMVISLAVTMVISRDWKTKKIVEQIGFIE